MPVTAADYLKKLELDRSSLKRRVDEYEIGSRDLNLTEAQRYAALRYMTRGAADLDKLIREAKKKIKPRTESIHLF